MLEHIFFDINKNTIVDTYISSPKFHQSIIRKKNHNALQKINERITLLDKVFDDLSANFEELQKETFTQDDIADLTEIDDILDNALNTFEKILGSNTVDSDIQNLLEKETLTLYTVSYMIKVIQDDRDLINIIGVLPTIKRDDIQAVAKEIRTKRNLVV